MIQRRSTLALLAAAASTTLLSTVAGRPARATGNKPTIAVIGTGEVGSALGKRWAALGYQIVYGSRTPGGDRIKTLIRETGHGASAETNANAAAKADMAVLALPWVATENVIKGMGDLSGKILMDPINGLKVTNGRFEAPPGLETSSGEMIQEWAHGAHVVKAFNTLSREVMEDPAAASGPVTVSLAGDNAEAKARVGAIAADMGLVPLDVGAIYLARYLEGMARLRIAFRAKNKPAAIEFHLQSHQG